MIDYIGVPNTPVKISFEELIKTFYDGQELFICAEVACKDVEC